MSILFSNYTITGMVLDKRKISFSALLMAEREKDR